MANIVQKQCCSCGQDVANQKRTKDAAGRYYCQRCYEARRKDKQYHCPLCNKQFTVEGMDSSGICRDCAATNNICATSNSTQACSACGAAVLAEVAYCGRCGAKQDGGMSIEEEIDLSSLVSNLGKYGELSHALSMSPQVQQTLLDAVNSAIRRNDRFAVETIREQSEKAMILTKKTTLECEEVKSRLIVVDRERLIHVRDVILENATVSQDVKYGLQYDALGIFCAKPSGNANRSPPALQSKDSSPPPPIPQAAQAENRSPNIDPKQLVLWLLFIGGCLIGLYLLYHGGWNLYHGFLNAPENGMRQLIIGGIQAFVGLVLLVGCLTSVQNACPACHHLGVAQLCDATLLDRRMESESIEHHDRHYGADATYLGSTRREGQRLVTVDTVLKQYLCKDCGHCWEKVVKTKA